MNLKYTDMKKETWWRDCYWVWGGPSRGQWIYLTKVEADILNALLAVAATGRLTKRGK